ncbi:MAG: aspartate-alanine antiporter [Muribaculaceae bacterium]|nr:aspartate-alanine antiporter [Muribaculaceae bacterium]
MDYIIQLLRDNPTIPLFLTLGIGFWLGGLRLKGFSLGPVTATLLVGVLIGQLDIPIAEPLKTVSFLLFLFAIGYRVGPQFFRGLKGDGVRQMLFAVVECVICIVVCIVAARMMGYNTGTAIGLFAGSQTISASIGVGSDIISSMKIDPEMKKTLTGMIPSAYAVTYIFGTIGAAWIVANLGPKLCGGLDKAKRQIAEIEAEMEEGEFSAQPGLIVANRPVSFRAYRAESRFFRRPRTVSEIEEALAGLGHRLFVERLRVGGEVVDVEPDVKVRRGDVLVIGGRRETVVNEAGIIGQEVVDHELLDFEAENLPVTVSKNGAAGLTFGSLRKAGYMSGVMVKSLVRDDVKIPLHSRTMLEAGDVLTLVGLQKDVAQAVGEIGYPDRKTETTDVAFLSFGVALGCFIGALCVHFKGVPISLTTSGGSLLAGLFFGWLRNRKPTLGRIPSSVVWVLDNVGLCLFIAIVGLAAGPTFVSGLKEAGIGLFFVGIACTVIPLVISIFIGHYIFRFPIAVTLGCVAGGRNAVAALGAIQDNLESTLPAMGYTVTYAVSNFLLIFGGIAVALLV